MTMTVIKTCEHITDVQILEDILIVEMVDGSVIAVPLEWYPQLMQATPEQQSNWCLSEGCYGIQWSDIGVDMSMAEIRGDPAAPCHACWANRSLHNLGNRN